MAKTVSWKATGWIIAVAIVVVSAVFLIFPQVDIWASAIFFDPEKGFNSQYPGIFHVIRMGLFYSVALIGLASLALLGWSLAIGRRRRVPLAIWGYIVTTFLVGPLFLTNSILKSFWGRARPQEIDVFGGTKLFSPPWVITDQCDLNCSFVSGEGSALAAVILVLAVVLWPNITGIWRFITAGFLLPLAIFGIALRVITGAHFLSDSLLAILLMALVAWVFYGVFNMHQHRHDLTWANLRKDLSKSQ